MDRQAIREYIHKQKKTATEDEKQPWGLIQMWNDTRSFEVFDHMVRFSLKEAQDELKKPFDPIWRTMDERDARVYGEIVKWLDEQKEAN